MMRPEELERIGRYLFGARWRHGLSSALGRSYGQVKHWHTGERPIPEDMAGLLRAMAADPTRHGCESRAVTVIQDIERICALAYSGKRKVQRIQKRIAEFKATDPPA